MERCLHPSSRSGMASGSIPKLCHTDKICNSAVGFIVSPASINNTWATPPPLLRPGRRARVINVVSFTPRSRVPSTRRSCCPHAPVRQRHLSDRATARHLASHEFGVLLTPIQLRRSITLNGRARKYNRHGSTIRIWARPLWIFAEQPDRTNNGTVNPP